MVKTISLVIAAMLFVCASAGAVTIGYSSNSVGATDSGGTPLPTGDLIQIIYAGPNGLIDDWCPYNDMIGGDDVLLFNGAIDDGIMTFPADMTGHGNFDSSQNTSAVQTGDVVYLRVFNAPNTAAATEGATRGTLTIGPTGYDQIVAPGLITEPIPEPSIMLVSGLALLLLRKKK